MILDDNLTVAFLVSELLTVDATSSESLFNFDYSEGLVINNASRHMKKLKQYLLMKIKTMVWLIVLHPIL